MEKQLNTVNFVQQLLELRSGAAGNADEHSMEAVAQVSGVLYVNDSKATSAENTKASLDSIPGDNVVLIVGGSDHRNDYSSLALSMRNKVKVVVYLGSDNDHLLRHISKEPILFTPARTLEEAVAYAGYCVKEGDVVLFSPACPSFDPFDNYKTRGIRFRKIVNDLIQEK
jgi:UDP-N-acetylmuramoylalanine--D-glutamate ligase